MTAWPAELFNLKYVVGNFAHKWTAMASQTRAQTASGNGFTKDRNAVHGHHSLPLRQHE